MEELLKIRIESTHINISKVSRGKHDVAGSHVKLVEWSDGVVVITSALHAEGREFDPRSDLSFKVVSQTSHKT